MIGLVWWGKSNKSNRCNRSNEVIGEGTALPRARTQVEARDRQEQGWRSDRSSSVGVGLISPKGAIGLMS